MDKKFTGEHALAEEAFHSFLHDLSNLMLVISYQSEIGHEAQDLQRPELRAVLGRIHQTARMAIKLIEWEEQGDAVSERFDLRLIVHRVAEVVQCRRQDGTRICCIVPHVPVWITGHSAAIMRVCLNLALNAVDASAGGQVTLSVSTCSEPPDAALLVAGVVPKSPWIVLAVADDGPGIPLKLRERIWETGFTGKGVDGSGLGLALVRRLVNEAQAGVTLDTGVGTGTCFRVYWHSGSTDALDPAALPVSHRS
jgi:signal transduction histidine kinase